MVRKRKLESEEERRGRVRKNAQDAQDAGAREDEAMDAMVRESLKRHGA